jgi:hypothetical protein
VTQITIRNFNALTYKALANPTTNKLTLGSIPVRLSQRRSLPLLQKRSHW